MMFKVTNKGFKMFHMVLIGCLMLIEVSGQSPQLMSQNDELKIAIGIFKKAYQSIVEINDENKTISILEYEYNDPDNKRNAIIQYMDKKNTRILQYTNFNQVLTISDDERKCTVSNILSIIDKYPFGEENTENKLCVYRASKIIPFVDNARMVTKESNIIKGIKVDSWRVKFDWNKNSYEMVLNFAAKNVGSISGSPVRFTLVSKSQCLNYTYEYYSFFTSIQDNSDTAFESPKGVVCKGRKSNMTLASLPSIFSTRIELAIGNVIKIVDVSYNKPDELLRIDYQPGGLPDSPHPNIINTISEIYDYNTGIRYLKDLVFGNCSASEIHKSSLGNETLKDMIAEKVSFEGYVIRNIFAIVTQKNFEYVGLRTFRNIECYVFAAHRKEFMIQDGSVYPATYEIYLASNKWNILPDGSDEIYQNYPVMINIITDKGDFSYQLNFIDFVNKQTDLATFDISSCYGTSTKMHISILLSGNYMKSTKDAIEVIGKFMIKTLMNVNVLQVQNVQLSYDANVMYLYATIIDRKPAEAQFTLKSTNSERISGDKTLKEVSNYKDCAEECVNYKRCNAFVICGTECTLSINNFNGKTKSDSSLPCRRYSKTLSAHSVDDTSLQLAFKTLQNAIAQRKFVFTVNAGNIKAEYIGLFARLDAGKLLKAALPTFDDDFQYHSEIVFPSKNDVKSVTVYYDETRNLSRYDENEDMCSGLCNRPSKIVQDFTAGISYIIDKDNGFCQIQPLFDTFDVAYADRMKSSAQIFFFDKTYTYVGQKHVRGILTNIFESYVVGFNNNRFRYYFLDGDWTGSPFHVPVRLEITSDDDTLYRADNFFEFLDDILFNTFDISSCYREINKITDLQIVFKGAYKERPMNFITAVVNKIKAFIHLPQLNLQNPELSYDSDNTYLRISLIDPSPLPIGLFSLHPKTSAKASSSETKLNIQTPNDCAALCIKKNCNTFTYCEGKKVCQLFSKDPGNKASNDHCNLYSKTKKMKNDVSSSKQVINDLLSLIHSGQFIISFTVEKEQQFTAISMLTNIDRSDLKSISSVQNMKFFTKLDKSGTLKSTGPVYKQISVDECAKLCTANQILNCEAFTYCQVLEMCVLSDIHPNAATNIQKGDACNIYKRNYVNMFDQIPGKTFPMKGKILSIVAKNADVCAKTCIDNGIKSCQSFEFCPSQETCSLSSQHVLDIPSTDIISTEDCNLYTVSALQHFVQSTTKIEKLHSNLLVQNISLKACAKLCIDDEGFGCISFNYCPGNSICQIKGSHQKEVKVESNIQANCSHYIKIDPTSHAAPVSVKKSGNRGQLVGLGIGTFIIGCILGLITILIIHKKACIEKKEDAMKVNFFKMDDQ